MPLSPPDVQRQFKVLGDESRLRILQALERGERAVSEILEETGLAQTLASFHLRTLREAGVVTTERRGPFIFYSLADPSLPNLLEACSKGTVDPKGPKAPDGMGPPPMMREMMQKMAGALEISPESALYFLGKLVREGKATIGAIQATRA